jgi:hypothetical protein
LIIENFRCSLRRTSILSGRVGIHPEVDNRGGPADAVATHIETMIIGKAIRE